MGLGILLHLGLGWIIWKGSASIRFAVALIYLTFLQYTPWQGHFIEAPRYLLLPSVGGALLMAWAFLALLTHGRIKGVLWRRAIIGVVALYMLANIIVIQTWIGQHIENGHFRRTVVTDLHRNYLDVVEADDLVWIEVPSEKYTDLADSCRLVFQQYFVRCLTYVAGEALPSAVEKLPAERTFYWLEATPQGIFQRYPP